MARARSGTGQAAWDDQAASEQDSPWTWLRQGGPRNTELLMIVFALVLSLYAYAEVGLATKSHIPGGFVTVGGGLSVVALGAHLAVRRFAPYADPLILPITTLLSGIGLVLIYRLDISYKIAYNSPPAGSGQVMWSVIGVAAFAIMLGVLRDYRQLQRYLYISALVALVLLMAPAFFPGDTYGAKRWIRLGSVLQFQPGEFVKIIITVFFAGYLTMQRDALALTGRHMGKLHLPRGRQLGPIVTVWIFSLLVLVFERDLGTSLIFFGVFVMMLYIATERTSWLIFGVIMSSIGAAVVGTLEPHVHGRVVAWLHPLGWYLPPGQRPAGIVSDQAAQALFSFGSGGIMGRGLGQGHSELIGFAGRSDFILTTVGEELGLAGLTAILLLYTLLAQRGLRTALAARDPFGKLLAAGLSSVIVLQVFVVAGGVTGLVPLTGKALPFLAQGGSSLVANWLLVGVLIKISDGARRPAPKPVSDHTMLGMQAIAASLREEPVEAGASGGGRRARRRAAEAADAQGQGPGQAPGQGPGQDQVGNEPTPLNPFSPPMGPGPSGPPAPSGPATPDLPTTAGPNPLQPGVPSPQAPTEVHPNAAPGTGRRRGRAEAQQPMTPPPPPASPPSAPPRPPGPPPSHPAP